jgi:hypothetical protein
MPTVRISGNLHNLQKIEWAGAPKLGGDGKIERAIAIPEEVYLAIEEHIARGLGEGSVVLPDGRRFEYFVDRAPGK